MKTLLFRVGAALLVSTIAANAKIIVSLDTKCDIITLTPQRGIKTTYSAVGIYSVDATGVSCEDALGYGGVSAAQSLGGGTFANLGMIVSGDSDLYTLQLQYPLANGNAWYKYKSTDGINFNQVDTGTYTVTRAFPSQVKPASRGR